MRRSLTMLLLGLLLAGNALADTITITAPWTQVRRTPSMDGRAIDIVYGNDVFTVLEVKSGFAKIRTHRKIEGWVLLNDGDLTPGGGAPAPAPPGPAGKKPEEKKAGAGPPGAPGGKTPAATALSNATSLRQLGYRDPAREKFTEVILGDPGSPEAYEATRQMLNFYPVGSLPPLKNGQIPPDGQQPIGPVSSGVLLQEAIVLQGEARHARAARVYRYLLEHDPENGRAFLGLYDSLQLAMADDVKASKEEDLAKAVALFRMFFPDNSLPGAVEQHLAQAQRN